MKRQVVAGLIGLALTGCAQSRSTLKKDKPDDPVGLKPIPAIHDTINRGMGGPAVVNSTLPNPSNPHWAGTASPIGAGPSGAVANLTPSAAIAGSGALASPSTVLPTAASAPAAGYPLAADSRGPAMGMPVATGAESAPGMMPPQGGAFANGQPGSTLETRGMMEPLPSVAGTAGMPAMGEPAAAASLQPLPESSALPDLPPIASDLGAVTPGAAMGVGSSATSDPAVSPSGTSLTAPPGVSIPTQRMADPLLGPNPDLMPPLDASAIMPRSATNARDRGTSARPKQAPPASLPDGGSTSPATSALAAPAAIAPAGGTSATGAGPAMVGVTEAAEAPGAGKLPAPPSDLAAPVELAPPGDLAPPANLAPAPVPAPTPAGSDKPAGTAFAAPSGGLGSNPSINLVSADSLESAPSTQPDPGTVTNIAGAARIDTTTVDSTPGREKVVLASYQQKPPAVSRVDELRTDPNHSWTVTGRPAARVGDDIITLEDFISAIREYKRVHIPPGTELSRVESEMLGRNMLNDLINRAVLVQEVKREVKNPKDLDRLMSVADKIWHEEEIPPLLSKYTAVSERELAEKLQKQGRSLGAMKEDHKQQILSQMFVHEKLKDQVKVSLPDLKKYYHEHAYSHDFDHPAELTWREIVIENHKNVSREAALQKANGLLERIRKGEDLAKLAKTESDGPLNSRAEGGLMRTSPGGYAITEVNQALETLPLGQTSGVIAGSDGFHIVRVEKRRAAGPLSFEEVNDKIRMILIQQRGAEASSKLIEKIRKRTLVTTMFDSMDRKPNQPDGH